MTKAYTTGVKINSDERTITFEFEHSQFDELVEQGLSPFTRITIGDETTELTEKLKKLIDEHEDKLHYGYGSSDQAEVIRQLFLMYERNAAEAIIDAQKLQSDMVLWLQALAMCAQMVSNGATHAEKDARMRGFIEMVESALSKFKEYDYRLDHFNRRSYRPDDLWKNDYPVRHYKDRAHRAEQELAELKKSLIEKPQGENGHNPEPQNDAELSF